MSVSCDHYLSAVELAFSTLLCTAITRWEHLLLYPNNHYPFTVQIALCKANAVGPAFSQLLQQDLVLGEGPVSVLLCDNVLNIALFSLIFSPFATSCLLIFFLVHACPFIVFTIGSRKGRFCRCEVYWLAF